MVVVNDGVLDGFSTVFTGVGVVMEILIGGYGVLDGFSTVFTGVGVLMESLIGGYGVAVEGVST